MEEREEKEEERDKTWSERTDGFPFLFLFFLEWARGLRGEGGIMYFTGS